MQTLEVDGLIFDFPDNWVVSKYDDWSFYNNRFKCMWNGIKGLDLLAVSPSHVAWLVEVKDYRTNRRTKAIDLSEEVSRKAFDTLASLLPAKVNGNVQEETEVCREVLRSVQLRVVLHLEQPAKHSKLYPRAIDPANVQMKLRQLIKPIDAHPRVVEKTNMTFLEWSVR